MSTPRKRRTSRASFGSVRKLPSGRYQARYVDRMMNRHTAPRTFTTKREAEDWLATTRADIVRGTWLAPNWEPSLCATSSRTTSPPGSIWRPRPFSSTAMRSRDG